MKFLRTSTQQKVVPPLTWPGSAAFLHTKLVRFGYILLNGSSNASTAALGNIETCTLTWLNERGHAKYLDLERHILVRSIPYRGEGTLT